MNRREKEEEYITDETISAKFNISTFVFVVVVVFLLVLSYLLISSTLYKHSEQAPNSVSVLPRNWNCVYSSFGVMDCLQINHIYYYYFYLIFSLKWNWRLYLLRLIPLVNKNAN